MLSPTDEDSIVHFQEATNGDQPSTDATRNVSPSPKCEADRRSSTTPHPPDLTNCDNFIELNAEITDAVSESTVIKFTIKSRVLREIDQPCSPSASESPTKSADISSCLSEEEYTVTREHSDFVWLHWSISDSESYVSYIVPPCPVETDFNYLRERLNELSSKESTLTPDEFAKMKDELQSEYLATFKKTVSNHSSFLQRLVTHPVLRHDQNLFIFLTYADSMNVRTKNKREKLTCFLTSLTKSTDELILDYTNILEKSKSLSLSTPEDVALDNYFEKERQFLTSNVNELKNVSIQADKVVSGQRIVGRLQTKLASIVSNIASLDAELLATDSTSAQDSPSALATLATTLDQCRSVESRAASDQDLKLNDVIKVQMREASAARDMLYRRLRAIANLANSHREVKRIKEKQHQLVRPVTSIHDFNDASTEVLERRRQADLAAADKRLISRREFLTSMSARSKTELADFTRRRSTSLTDNVVQQAQLQIKHARSQIKILEAALAAQDGNSLSSE